MTLLANATFARMGAGIALTIVALFLAIAMVRLLRRHMVEEQFPSNALSETAGSYPFSAVIQQLKQQKFALQHEQQEQQRRAKNSEHVTASVIAALPCGVLFIAPNGLVRQANAAARQILGFASPLGMSVEEIFRDAKSIAEVGTWLKAADSIRSALAGHIRSGDLEFIYETPSGETRSLKLLSIHLRAPAGEPLGIAVVISDGSAHALQRRAELLRAESSAEMALELRSSLATVRECAMQIAANNDYATAKKLVNDICTEIDQVGRSVGGFLTKDQEGKALAAKA